MNAQEVISYLKFLDGNREYFHTESGGDVYFPRISVEPENRPLFDRMFELAGAIEPCDWYRGGNDRSFWIWTDKGSYDEFVQNYKDHFTYITIGKYFNGEGGELDHEKMKAAWPEYFPEDRVWFHIYLAEVEGQRYLRINKNTYFCSKTLDAFSKKTDAAPLFNWIIGEEQKIIGMIKEGTYTDFIEKNLSYHHRSGYTDMATYWKYVPEHRERLFGKIDPDEFQEFLAWDAEKECGWDQMSSRDYFEICNGLYELLGLKDEYPVHKKDNSPVSLKDYYMAYAAMYSSVKSFINLEETSCEEFRRFVEEEQTEHHTWEVCLSPDIHLYPMLINDRFFIYLFFDHKVDDYDKLIHLCLEMRKKGFPMMKPKEIEERMGEKRLIRINPSKTVFDSEYAWSQNINLEENGKLPEGRQEEFVREIHWFPVGEWKLETAENRIKIGCPRCGCDRTKIRYQNSGPIVRLRCPECGLTVDDRAVIKGRFEDIFRFWNWMSYFSQRFGDGSWERIKRIIEDV